MQSGGLQDNLGFQIAQANSSVRRYFEENFPHLGVTLKQIACLILLEERSQSQSAFAGFFGIHRETARSVLLKLETAGMIAMDPAFAGKRERPYTLTATGLAALPAYKRAIADCEEWLTSRYSASERTTLLCLLGRAQPLETESG